MFLHSLFLCVPVSLPRLNSHSRNPFPVFSSTWPNPQGLIGLRGLRKGRPTPLSLRRSEPPPMLLEWLRGEKLGERLVVWLDEVAARRWRKGVWLRGTSGSSVRC
ncbi:hypothetical protein DL98DRAFT_300669 [Cadophora sp. DSE1049]|nr:hypothetical protein DL98DRAFT_300669 [Cadophora sp. DSE1049]